MHTKTVFELLHESSKAISSEIELENVVQRATDIGTELTGAQFGAFFYNVINARGESLILYTISGVDKEAFAKFPMPRNTKIFEPTFAARGTVRYNDVTKEPHYAQNPPYHGMPAGHLPVRSYLAVPVISPVDKEPIGGLFFGHSEPGVFTESSEHLIEGVAQQAAIAVVNARLFREKTETERRLMEQTEQYKSIFNATSDSLIIYDADGTIVQANPAASRMFGYSYEELIGLPADRLFLRPKDFQGFKEIVLSGRNYNGITTRLRKDGSTFDVRYQASPFLYNGQTHVLSAAHPIEDDSSTKAALQRSEALTQVITKASPVTLWMTDSSAETVYINQTWIDWVGGALSDHLGLGWIGAILPEDRQLASETFMHAFRHLQVFTMDFRIRRRNGEVRWVSSHGAPYFNASGNFEGYAGSLTDITVRKEVEQKLSSQNVLINTITNNTQQALLLMDDRQVCTYMNPAAEAMTGFKLEEVRAKPLHYYVHHTHPDGRHFPIEDCPIDRALPTKAHTQGEAVFIHKDGHFYPVAFTASPIIDNGVPLGTVIEARDTTEEKRIQEALRSREQLEKFLLEEKVRERTAELEKSNYELLQFTSVASHDLKEPVRKISIFSKMLQERMGEEKDAATHRYLNNIITSSERMAQLIDDLLAFARLSHADVSFEAVDLNAVVDRIREDLEIPIRETGATIDSGRLPVIRGIELQLGQVFQNLISNSLKFRHPDRPPLIRIECAQKGFFYELSYEDNGIGFDPEQEQKIFEVFYRLHARTEYEGTGVGLSIVQKIVELHGGNVRAEGKKGVGAVFIITLPA